MEPIKISTGNQKIPIERDGVVVGHLSINTSDVEMRARFFDFYDDAVNIKAKEFEARAAKLDEGKGVDENQLPLNTKERIAFQVEMSAYIRQGVDSIFGPNTYEMVFGAALLEIDVYVPFFQQLRPIFEAATSEKVKTYTRNRHKPHSKAKKAGVMS